MTEKLFFGNYLEYPRCIKVAVGLEIDLDFNVVTISGAWDPSLTDKNKKVIISGDVTLNGKTDCYSITFETGGHLTINAGARLRVWQGGIVNNDCTTVNYLTIIEDAVNDSYGEFLLHPDVTDNNHPLASVELISNSYTKSGSDWMNQRFSIPTINQLYSMTTKYNDANVQTALAKFTKGDWVDFGWINITGRAENLDQMATPFETYMMQHNTPNLGTSVVMTGNLYANVDGTLNLLGASQNGFINTWTGRIKVSDFVNLFSSHNVTNINCEISGISPWNDINNYDYIRPIYTAIIIVNSGAAATITLSYKDLVWDSSFEEEITPTRGLMKGALTAPKPVEIDTTLEGSAIFDNPEPSFPPEPIEK